MPPSWRRSGSSTYKSAEELTGPEDQSGVAESVDVILTRLEELLQGVSLVKECTPRTQDGVLSVGEQLSTLLVAAALRARGTRSGGMRHHRSDRHRHEFRRGFGEDGSPHASV